MTTDMTKVNYISKTTFDQKTQVDDELDFVSVGGSLSLPSGTFVSLTLGSSGITYTAPADGWFTCYFAATSAQIGTWVNNANGMTNSGGTAGSYSYVGVSIPAKKGDMCQYYYNHPTPQLFGFVYAVGSEWEA